MIKNIFRLKQILILVMLLAASFSVQAQTGNIKKVKNKNAVKPVSDWRDAFPAVPNYQRKFDKVFLNSERKLHYQKAKYQNPTDKSDYFEIVLTRHPDISFNRYASESSDWVKPLTIGEYKFYQIYSTCGLDFVQYRLETYPSEKTAVTLELPNGSKTDLLKLAEILNYKQISENMKKRKNIY